MTLSTRIYLQKPIRDDVAEEIFAHIRRMLGAGDNIPVEREKGSISHPWGVGLDAYAGMTFSTRKMARESRAEPMRYGCILFDTTYGFRGPQNETCGQLHAALIAGLAPLLRHLGIPFVWVNEFSGAAYEGTDGLDSLCEGGRQATAWFDTTVKPAIEARIDERGR